MGQPLKCLFQKDLQKCPVEKCILCIFVFFHMLDWLFNRLYVRRSIQLIIALKQLPAHLFSTESFLKEKSWIPNQLQDILQLELQDYIGAVSYTHLTLPTIYSV